MKLTVFVAGESVAVLESVGDFKSVLTYAADTPTERFVSLTMPVRTESWVWDDTLPPVLQMNLPEGYLFQVLQERFGPHIGASPLALLAVIGRNMIGRLQVAPLGAQPDSPPRALDVAGILQGDNSEEAFAELVREYATSGVSGLMPKFLDSQPPTATLGVHQKASLVTRRYIVKGSSRRLPFLALNEHFCMQIAAKLLPSARTQVSEDGQALVVERFDTDADGNPHWGMEDFCALLGLRPAAKYETTWERIARAVHNHVPGVRQRETFEQLATTLLLTYALRNADCHAKNVALLYTSHADVHLAPVYDMVTTQAYSPYAKSPPGIAFMGKKTWSPGKNLPRFLTTVLGVPVNTQQKIVEAIADAMSPVARAVRREIRTHPTFGETGKAMLQAWEEGLGELRGPRVYAAAPVRLGRTGSAKSQRHKKRGTASPHKR